MSRNEFEPANNFSLSNVCQKTTRWGTVPESLWTPNPIRPHIVKKERLERHFSPGEKSSLFEVLLFQMSMHYEWDQSYSTFKVHSPNSAQQSYSFGPFKERTQKCRKLTMLVSNHKLGRLLTLFVVVSCSDKPEGWETFVSERFRAFTLTWQGYV